MKIGCGWCAPESELATLFNFPALWQAYITCRKGKRGSRNTQHYEISLLDRLIDTLDALKTARWTPSCNGSMSQPLFTTAPPTEKAKGPMQP